METVVRVAVLYLFLMLVLRVMGKREFSELTPFDLVTLILIPDIVQQALIREDYSMTNALVALCTLFTLHRVGLETIDQVKWVILEPDGRISIIPVRREDELEQSSEHHRSTT